MCCWKPRATSGPEASILLPRSHRYPWEQPKNALAEALHAAKRSGLPLLDLTISNPTRAELELPDPWTLARLDSQRYEPESSGLWGTREAICRYYEEEFQSRIEPSRIVLTTSTSESYSYCFKAIADAGEEILIPEPSYPLLRFLIEAEGLVAVPYPLLSAGGEWLLDRDAIVRATSYRTRGLVVVHPNNPPGHYQTAEDWRWLLDWAAERFWLLSDEVFADYCWLPRAEQVRSATGWNANNVIVLSGLSKVCALPGMKLGGIVLPDCARLQQDFEWIADTCLSVSAPIPQAAPAWIAARREFQSPVKARCRESLERIATGLRNSPWTALPVEGGWMAILQGPSHIDEQAFVLRLLSEGLSTHPGYYYDLPFPAALVVSLLSPPALLGQGLQRITSF